MAMGSVTTLDGLMGDKFIDDPTQWNDTDGDGYGDNPLGNSPDSCPISPDFLN